MAAGTGLFRMADTEPPPPKDVHILIPQACDCANLPGKRNFVAVIKPRISDEVPILEYPGRPDVITRLLTYKKEEEITEDRRCYDVGFEDGGRTSQAKNVGSLFLSWKRQRKIFSPRASRR